MSESVETWADYIPVCREQVKEREKRRRIKRKKIKERRCLADLFIYLWTLSDF